MTALNAFPTTFPGQNTHRVVLFQPDRAGTEFERLEDMAADAIGAARRAVAEFDELPYEVFKPLQQQAETLREAVARRRVLSDEVRFAMEEMLRHLARVEHDETTAPLFERLMRGLRDALEGSHRVADLLAAEKDIGWHRGLRG